MAPLHVEAILGCAGKLGAFAFHKRLPFASYATSKTSDNTTVESYHE